MKIGLKLVLWQKKDINKRNKKLLLPHPSKRRKT